MELDTTITPKPKENISTSTTQTTIKEEVSSGVGSVSKDSRIFGVSIMAWTLLILVLTICYCQIASVGLYDHLINLSLFVIGFYGGKSQAK